MTLEIEIDTEAFDRVLDDVGDDVGAAAAADRATDDSTADRPTLPSPESIGRAVAEEQRVARASSHAWTDVETPSQKLFAVREARDPRDAVPVLLVAPEDLSWFDLSEAAARLARRLGPGVTVAELTASIDGAERALRELVEKKIARVS